jgi:hypothetical protein
MFPYHKDIFQRLVASDSVTQGSESNDIFRHTLWSEFDKRSHEYEYELKLHGDTHARLLNWIGSIDYSGYTREKCLRALIGNYQFGDENRILLRLVDWVPQIEQLATNWIVSNFSRLSLDSIHANQGLLLYLSRKNCTDGNPAMSVIKRDLLERCSSITKQEFFSFNSMFRRYLNTISSSNDSKIRKWLIDDPDPFNRLELLRSVSFHALSAEEVLKFKSDKSLFVKRSFFYAQIQAGIIPTEAELLTFAFDAKQSLRIIGQFYLKKFYQHDAYALYRAKTGAEFYYIADYVRAEDTIHYIDGIRNGSVDTKYLCLRALAFVSPENLAQIDLISLIRKNRKFRSLLLPHLPTLLTIEQLMNLRELISNSSTHGILSYLTLLEQKSYWTFVDECLALWLNGIGNDLREKTGRMILHKSEIVEKLTPKRRESIENKLIQLKKLIPWEERFFDNLKFIMKP